MDAPKLVSALFFVAGVAVGWIAHVVPTPAPRWEFHTTTTSAGLMVYRCDKQTGEVYFAMLLGSNVDADRMTGVDWTPFPPKIKR